MKVKRYIEAGKEKLREGICGKNLNNKEIVCDTFATAINIIEIQENYIKDKYSEIDRLNKLCHEYAGCTKDNCNHDGNNCPALEAE